MPDAHHLKSTGQWHSVPEIDVILATTITQDWSLSGNRFYRPGERPWRVRKPRQLGSSIVSAELDVAFSE